MPSANSGDDKCLTVLIDAGASVNIQDEDGNTAFNEVTVSCSDECLEVLIKSGAKVKKQNKMGETALHAAAYYGSWKRIETLLEAGADVNSQDTDGQSILTHAIRSHKCGQHCLKTGALIKLLDKDGGNALTYYILRTRKKYLDQKVIKLLYAAGKTIDEIKVPKYVKKSQLDLKSICRKAVRKHLLDIDPHQHLYGRIPLLDLPSFPC